MWRTIALAVLALSGCTSQSPRDTAPRAPYPSSRVVRGIDWDFATLETHRQAHGSDLWPCAWAVDDALYCAWGDGGGFDGDDDHIGRVSLGFARVIGMPSAADPAAVVGRNVWGALPYAETSATFGGKVGSLTAVGGVLYAHGGFWTSDVTRDPAQRSGRGPLSTVAWSGDGAHSWHLAPWSSRAPLGAFLDRGRDSPADIPPYVLLYTMHAGDDRHLYLERTRPARLLEDPAAPGVREFFAGLTFWRRAPRWSADPRAARPVFEDAHHVEGPTVTLDRGLGRYLLTAGHYASGNDDDSSAGQVGLFEAPNPWGPWRTIGYYEQWGGAALNRETHGDFLGLRIPSKWISSEGTELWAVFSGPRSFDAFNLVRARLIVRGER
ncbi:MAG TPA: hypothetical protein VKT22_05240 [Steroidobacteraceae bacterium]|nr:hypothetical protein [Steroidobacteraceae bacterium]